MSRFPFLSIGTVNKMLRKKAIARASEWDPDSVDKIKAEAKERIVTGNLFLFPKSLWERHVAGETRCTEVPKLPNVSVSPDDIKEARKWILWEDDHYVAINKPDGIVTHSGPKSGMTVDVIMSHVLQHPVHLVHRLDKDTSGVMLIAKSRQAAERFTKLLNQHDEVVKVYMAIVVGRPEVKSGVVKHWLSSSGSGRFGPRQCIVPHPAQRRTTREKGLSARLAVTRYSTISYGSDSYTALALSPKTGRKHQLRVACAESLGTAIVGDHKYGIGVPMELQTIVPRKAPMMLHSHRLEFIHPFTNKLAVLRAPLRGLKAKVWSSLGLKTTTDDFGWQTIRHLADRLAKRIGPKKASRTPEKQPTVKSPLSVITAREGNAAKVPFTVHTLPEVRE